ncbi:MAG TPA: hypothetical protein VK025_10250 [Steroidobacter sp.]|nr:hypothetical protein [Steroidobacter sp.]
MNRPQRIAAFFLLIVLIAAAIVLAMRPAAPTRGPLATAPVEARPVYDGSQPLRLELISGLDAHNERADLGWLEIELRRALARAGEPLASDAEHPTYTLRVAVAASGERALLAIVAPDYVLERERDIELPAPTRLGMMQGLMRQLPRFLGTQSDWTSFTGARNAAAYDAYTRALAALIGSSSHGFTRPPAAARSRTVERLEYAIRAEPRFVRARALLALSYLSLGGEDEPSLTQLAESSAARALQADADIADAHAALGIVALRRNQWMQAHEQLRTALRLEPDNPAALEALACLLADVGHYERARPVARRALALQPANIGAGECAAYLHTAEAARSDESPAQEDLATRNVMAAQVHALGAILAGDLSTAERLLRNALDPAQRRSYAAPMLQAAKDARHTPAALRAITRAANEGRISAASEILCGAALRQEQFVFNRMARLQRERAHVPLRIFWIPQADFLRRHPGFAAILDAAEIASYWQEQGAPDVCAHEPRTYGCRLVRN